MRDIKEIKVAITSLLAENKLLKMLVLEKDKVIKELTNNVSDLENSIEYSKLNGGIKKLVLKRY